MVSGKYRERVSIGYEGKTTNQRKEGEEWVDARGRRWTGNIGRGRNCELKVYAEQHLSPR